MVNRITLTLERPEYAALLEIAVEELRTPAEQARYILRCEFERRGLLIAKANGDHEHGERED